MEDRADLRVKSRNTKSTKECTQRSTKNILGSREIERTENPSTNYFYLKASRAGFPFRGQGCGEVSCLTFKSIHLINSVYPSASLRSHLPLRREGIRGSVCWARVGLPL